MGRFWMMCSIALLGLPSLALGQDLDGDGRPEGNLDCDDTDPTIYVNAPEICGDGIDQSCSGEDQVADEDEDGFQNELCGPPSTEPDCDDNDVLVYPGAAEICDGLDTDCDGEVPVEEGDEDGDGASRCEGDCDDANAQAFPGGIEGPGSCEDGVDNDCDGLVDGQVEACWKTPVAIGGERIQLAIAGATSLELDGSESADPNPDDVLIYQWELAALGETPASAGTLSETGGPTASINVVPEGAGPWVFAATLTLSDPYEGVASTEWELVFIPAQIDSESTCGAEPCAGCTMVGPRAGTGLSLVFAFVLVGLGRRRRRRSGARSTHAAFAGLGVMLIGGCAQPPASPFAADDADGDGFSALEDCEDRNASVFPGAADPYGDYVDTDCDGFDGVDRDGDGFPAAGSGVPADLADCDDFDSSVFPGAAENPFDEVDSDCDGATGLDGWEQGEDDFGGDAPDVATSGFTVPAVPWDAFAELGELSGGEDVVRGSTESEQDGDWSGDSDGYSFMVPFRSLVTVRLAWEGNADLDAMLYCYYWDPVNPPGWYGGMFQGPSGSGLATQANPEEGTSIVPLEGGSVCFVAVLPYSGSAEYELSFGAVPQ